MQRLREIRLSRGLTLKQLGDMVGKSESSIGQYENGNRSPDFETLLKLGEALDCSVDSILGNTFSLSAEEETILYLFRLLNADGKKQAMNILASLSNSPALAEKNSADAGSATA